MTTTFQHVGFRDGRNTFALMCPVCGADGELGVKPDDLARLIECPNKCGAKFMQRRPRSLFAAPVLEYVLGGKLRRRNRNSKVRTHEQR
jgi:hypothetical protein